MPRKTPNVLSKISTLLPNELMHRVAKELSEMPPAAYGLSIKTNDQAMAWREAKHFYKCVAGVIDAYMCGGKKPDYSAMLKEKRQLIDNEAWMSLSLYNLIFFNWEAIAPHLSEIGAPEMPAITGGVLPMKAREFSALDTPMEAFVEALKHRAIGHVHFAFSEQRTEFIPYRIRKGIENSKTARNKKTKKHVISQIVSEQAESYASNQWRILQDFCLVLAEQSRPAKLSAAKQSIDSYRKATSSDEAFWAKQMHKQKKPRRVVWENGYQIN